MRTIKLMPDYSSFPLWDMDEIYNIDPRELPISQSLQDHLLLWANKYDDILDMDDPSSSKFKTPEDEKKFLVEGLLLAQRLKQELGDNCKIEYCPLYTNNGNLSGDMQTIIVYI